ncbi:MAG: hypothetical protein CVV27_08455 [Candidatus Melainabacteria bacterium HGW-Melainabacteria-1]|nr:MAG: hypothetical protein CVV27_08455 [Candidatus Melainabacteria bacterium HGW-Melainabacteria-1]
MLILSFEARQEARSRYYEQGTQAFHERRWNDAILAYTEALNLGEDPNLLTNLGAIYQQNWKLPKAVELYRRALELDAAHPEARGNLANACLDMLEPEQALEHKRMSLAFQLMKGKSADSLQSHVELVFALTTLAPYHAYTAEMRQLCEHHLAHMYPTKDWQAGPVPADRKIRLGYISADFNRHTVMVLLEPLFNAYNADRFELHCYYNGTINDDMTARLRSATHFRDIVGMTDKRARHVIVADQLDLLVDLTGYSSGQRLSLLARKPAPRIATGLGFIAPIGCPSIDYALLDPAMVSDEQDQAGHVPENIARIPTNMFYRPEPELELKTPERTGVVFGSANSLFKVNQTVIECWAHILRMVPGSILRLKAKALSDPEVLSIARAKFAAHGIDPARVEGSGQATRREYMSWYHGVDICLDPFPYQGGVTSSEALYMGCPVIALDAAGINTTVSILQAADMGEYVTRSPEEYVRQAVQLGMVVATLGPEKRLGMRQHIRRQIQKSIIFDAGHFASSIEQAYEAMCELPAKPRPRRTR